MKPLNKKQRKCLLRLLFDSAILTVDGYYWDAENEKVDLRTMRALVNRGLAYPALKGIPGGAAIGAFYLTDAGQELAEELRWVEEEKMPWESRGAYFA